MNPTDNPVSIAKLRIKFFISLYVYVYMWISGWAHVLHNTINYLKQDFVVTLYKFYHAEIEQAHLQTIWIIDFFL